LQKKDIKFIIQSTIPGDGRRNWPDEGAGGEPEEAQATQVNLKMSN